MRPQSRWCLSVLALLFVLPAVPARALSPLHLFSGQYGSGGDSDNPRAITIDATGNLIMCGQYRNVANFGGSSHTAYAAYDAYIAKYNANAGFQWDIVFGQIGDDIPYALATDPSGNVYVTGSFAGSVSFGGSVLVTAGGNDIFLAKYSSGGTHQWSLRLGSTGNDIGYGIAVDATGAVYITGRFNGSIDFGAGPMPSTGLDDVFLAKYSTAGAMQWATIFGSTASDFGQDVALDDNGNLYVTGTYNGSISNVDLPVLTHAGGGDAFLIRFAAGGYAEWIKGIGSSGADVGFAVSADHSGNVLLAGSFSGTVDFGGGNVSSAGSTDAFLAKYSTSGSYRWAQRVGGTLADTGTAVTVDGSDNPVLVGTFQGIAALGTGTITSTGGIDGFVVRYFTDGTTAWGRQLGGVNTDRGYGVAVASNGSPWVTGSFMPLASFGGSTFGGVLADDTFLAHYSTDATVPRIRSIADIGNDQGRLARLTFDRSAHDDAVSGTPVIRYEAYRRNDATPGLLSESELAHLPARALLDKGWTEVGTADGHGRTQYSIDVPTLADSTVTLGMYRSVFFVRGATGVSLTFFDSPPDSGYSIDNLAPGIPGSFMYTAGDLTWIESSAADFDYFTVYGSNVDAFGSATIVNYTISTSMNVAASPYVYYFITATDFSGNEGKPAKVNTLSSTGGAPKSYVLSLANYPNPFNPRTTVSYTVPSRGRVSVVVYDAHGARVRSLFDGERPAGAYTVDWDGRGENGAVAASGVYFARIEENGAARSKKMVLLK